MKVLSRRSFLKATALTGAAILSVSCGAPAAPAGDTTAPDQTAGETTPAEVPAGGSDKVKLRFVTNHGAADVPLFTKVIENFANAEPGIEIDHLDIADGNAFYDAINAQGAAKELSDVWYTRTFVVPVYASKGWTMSLEDMVKADAEEVNVDDLWPAEVAQMTYQGKLYALPYDFSNIGIYFNKKIFEEAGVEVPPQEWNWDDLTEKAFKFTQKDDAGNFTHWGLQMYTWDWVFIGLMYGWGGKVFDEDLTKCIIDQKENVEVLKYFIDRRKQGMYPEAGATPEGVDPFAAGLIPMQFQGSWATVYMRDLVKDKFDFDCTAMPLSPSGQSCISAAGGAWGIAANTKEVKASWAWLKYLTNTESTNILISDPLRSIPGRKSSAKQWDAVASEGGLPPKNVTVFSKQMEIAHGEPYPAFWQSFANTWANQVVPLLDGTTDDDPAAVLKSVQDETNRLIEQQG